MEASLKSLIALLSEVAQECAAWCDTCTANDLKTVVRRVEEEGKSFLTITLPAFGQSFERCLDLGKVDSSAFPGFHRRQGLPVFLRGFLSQVFDPSSGLLLNCPSVPAIRAVRQLCLMFGKINEQCSPKRTATAMGAFVQCEKEVRQATERFTAQDSQGKSLYEEFARISTMLFSGLLTDVSNKLYTDGIVPKHGPGATADRRFANAKYDGQMWTSRLEHEFPHWEQLIPSESNLNWLDDVILLEPGSEVPVKVTPVPKTAKTPRIIAIEPTHMQYVQQGLLRLIADGIPRDNHSRNFISFESQEPNQQLARQGSLTGSLATLDLSEASDRVSNEHVRVLLRNHGLLRDAVDACRSRKAQLPGGSIVELSKFASMGSALCFPFEAMVFTTVVFVGIQDALNRPLTRRDIKSLYGSVRVYGDDIVVPVDYVLPVIRALEAYGYRVNERKSFWTGRFRESCGKEYYDGNDVSIVRLRRYLPESRQNVQEVVTAVSFRNQLFLAGYDRVVSWLDHRVGDIIPFPMVPISQVPRVGDYVSDSSFDAFYRSEIGVQLLGRLTWTTSQEEVRWDPHRHVPLVKGCVVKAIPPINRLDGVGALMKFFLHKTRSVDPIEPKDHLERSGRPRSARIKTGWYPYF